MRKRDIARLWPSGLVLGVRAAQTNDPVPPHDQAELDRLRYEAEQARAASARIQRELEDLKKQLPTDEQRARYMELEEQARKAEEDRLKKEGDFQAWRVQLQEKFDRDIQAERAMRENAEAKARSTEAELEQTLVGRCFSDASDLFGPTGKTVLLPEVAQSFFGGNVRVESVAGVNGGPSKRRVVVLDLHGAPVLDTKTGQPMEFGKAMDQLIESHPRREHLLRGSGKVGSGASGGAHGGAGNIDTTKLRPADFSKPEVREAVRESASRAGGLQFGPAFDRMRQNRGK